MQTYQLGGNFAARRGHRGGSQGCIPPPDRKRCSHDTWFHWKSSPKYICTAHYL